MFEQNYIKLLLDVYTNGQQRTSRVGDTLSVFGRSLEVPDLRYDLFPMLTTREMKIKGILGELAGFIRGAQDLATYKKFGCNYWDANAEAWIPNANRSKEDMQVGRIYGVQWRDWNGHYDQMQALLDGIKSDPMGRRHLLTTWNPDELEQMCLPPCHLLAQFYVDDKHLDCMVYMRSVDLCLGLPSDVVFYAALLCLVAKETGYKPGTLKFSFGDTHIYTTHIPTLKEQLQRKPFIGPEYVLMSDARLFSFQPQDLKVHYKNYRGGLKYELLV